MPGLADVGVGRVVVMGGEDGPQETLIVVRVFDVYTAVGVCNRFGEFNPGGGFGGIVADDTDIKGHEAMERIITSIRFKLVNLNRCVVMRESCVRERERERERDRGREYDICLHMSKERYYNSYHVSEVDIHNLHLALYVVTEMEDTRSCVEHYRRIGNRVSLVNTEEVAVQGHEILHAFSTSLHLLEILACSFHGFLDPILKIDMTGGEVESYGLARPFEST